MPDDTGTAAQGAKRCGWQKRQWLRAPAVARAAGLSQGSVVQGQLAGAGGGSGYGGGTGDLGLR